MKKFCDDCKALDSGNCRLQFKIERQTERILGKLIFWYKPLQECPKPKTYKKYIELLNENKDG